MDVCANSTLCSAATCPPSLPPFLVADAERALSASLAPLVSLRKLRLRSDYEVKEKAQAKVLTEAFPALPQSHSTLPLRHLYLGKQVKIPAAHLEEVVQQLAMTLRHLTLQFFNGRSGRNGETWQPREDRYDEFEASWKLPEWRWDFDQWEMKRLFGLWKNKGIKVDGSAVKALRVAEKYDRELIVFEEMEEENYHLLFRHWDS